MLGCIILGWAAVAYGLYKNFMRGGDFTRGVLDMLQFDPQMSRMSSESYDGGVILTFIFMVVAFILLCVASALYFG